MQYMYAYMCNTIYILCGESKYFNILASGREMFLKPELTLNFSKLNKKNWKNWKVSVYLIYYI